jgi:hypothetical protein
MHPHHFTPLLALFVAAAASAAPATGEFNQAEFEKRFRAADTGKTGKLSRQAAYKAFPRAPEFFDEIDVNKDNFITIKEVNQALDRRWDAAVKSNKYNLPTTPQTAPAADNTAAINQEPAFSSKAEAQRAHRYDYYESLAGDLESSRLRNQPTQPEPYPTLLKKSF